MDIEDFSAIQSTNSTIIKTLNKYNYPLLLFMYQAIFYRCYPIAVICIKGYVLNKRNQFA